MSYLVITKPPQKILTQNFQKVGNYFNRGCFLGNRVPSGKASLTFCNKTNFRKTIVFEFLKDKTTLLKKFKTILYPGISQKGAEKMQNEMHKMPMLFPRK